MSYQASAPIDVDTIIRRIKQAVEASRARTPGADAGDGARPPDLSRAPVQLPRMARVAAPLEPRDTYALDEFLRYHDEDFIRNAYRGALHREPDMVGGAAYVAQLRSGEASKMEILGRLRYSPEGRRVGVTVHGLGPAFALRLARRIPVLGRFLGIAQYLVRLPNVVRAHERLEAFVFHHQRETAQQFDDLAVAVEGAIAGLRTDVSHTERLLAEYEQRAEQLRQQFAEREQRTRDLETAAEHLRLQFAEHLLVTSNRIATLEATKSTLESSVGELRASLAQANARQYESELAIQDHRRSLADQARTIAAIDAPRGEPYSTREAVDTATVVAPSMDAFYVAFEDRFRGAPADIKSRMQVYLPWMQSAAAGAADRPILDLGCGRGEWLALLREEGLAARGVDANGVMAQACKEADLDVQQADALDALESWPERSLGAVTGFHIVEHLPFPTLVRLVDATYRALSGGGVVAFETPNPENLVVGSCSFWLDPTHERPLPPPVLKFVLERAGFIDVEIWPLHPAAEDARIKTGELEIRDRLNALLCGPRDYAAVARKPSEVRAAAPSTQ